MNLLQMALITATVCAAITVTAVAIRYGLTLRWEDHAAGRTMMLVTVATGVLAWTAVVRRIDETLTSIDLTSEIAVASTVAWAGIAVTYGWRWTLLGKRR